MKNNSMLSNNHNKMVPILISAILVLIGTVYSIPGQEGSQVKNNFLDKDYLDLAINALELHKALLLMDYEKQYSFYSSEFKENISLDLFIRHDGNIDEEIYNRVKQKKDICGKVGSKKNVVPGKSPTATPKPVQLPIDKSMLVKGDTGSPSKSNFFEFALTGLDMRDDGSCLVDGYIKSFNVLSKANFLVQTPVLPAVPAGTNIMDIMNQHVQKVYHKNITSFEWIKINGKWVVKRKIIKPPGISGKPSRKSLPNGSHKKITGEQLRMEAMRVYLDPRVDVNQESREKALKLALWLDPVKTLNDIPVSKRKDESLKKETKKIWEFYNEFTSTMPLNPKLWAKLGSIKQSFGEYSQAVSYFKKALNLEKKDPDYMTGLSDNLYLSGDIIEALKIYTRYYNQYLYTRKQKTFLVETKLLEFDKLKDPWKILSGDNVNLYPSGEVFAELGKFFAFRGRWRESALCYLKSFSKTVGKDKLENMRKKYVTGGIVQGSVSEILPESLMKYIPVLSYAGILRMFKPLNIAVYYSNDYIGTTGVKVPCKISVISKAYFLKKPFIYGNYVNIMVGMKRVPIGKRGLNVVVVNPETGEIEKFQEFDTSRKDEESQNLAEFIKQIEPGKIFVGAVKDDAGFHLRLPAIMALKTVGMQGKLLGKNRYSCIMIGVKGAEEGKSIEIVAEAPLVKTIEPGRFPEKMEKSPLPFLRNEAKRFNQPILYLYGNYLHPRFILVSPKGAPPLKTSF